MTGESFVPTGIVNRSLPPRGVDLRYSRQLIGERQT